MLTFNNLLTDAGISLSETVVFRHTPQEPQLQLLLPSFVIERPELFDAYQSTQSAPAAAVLKRAKTLAAFIGQERGQATFAGLWNVNGWREIQESDLVHGTPLATLKDLGLNMTVSAANADTVFSLVKESVCAEWVGKLVINWPSRGINWKLRAHNAEFIIRAIHEENQFAHAMPSWDKLSLRWQQLATLPSSWRTRLSDWRGIYFIFDEKRQLGYVGSATGAENILGRWRDYAMTGHGGNVGLRASSPDDLRFSILELTAPNEAPDKVVQMEENWMRRLHTRDCGLNGRQRLACSS